LHFFFVLRDILLILCSSYSVWLISVPSGQDVGHEGVITGRDAFSLRSPPASLAFLYCGSLRSRPAGTKVN